MTYENIHLKRQELTLIYNVITSLQIYACAFYKQLISERKHIRSGQRKILASDVLSPTGVHGR